MQNKERPLKNKNYHFAIKIIQFSQGLVSKQKEFVLSRQILKSGTAIGALIKESEFAASKADFINKLTVSLKEANETAYWLMLLNDTGYCTKEDFENLLTTCKELIAMLISSLKTLKKN